MRKDNKITFRKTNNCCTCNKLYSEHDIIIRDRQIYDVDCMIMLFMI